MFLLRSHDWSLRLVSLLEDLAASLPNFYDTDHRAAGGIVGRDREGQERHFALLSAPRWRWCRSMAPPLRPQKSVAEELRRAKKAAKAHAGVLLCARQPGRIPAGPCGTPRRPGRSGYRAIRPDTRCGGDGSPPAQGPLALDRHPQRGGIGFKDLDPRRRHRGARALARAMGACGVGPGLARCGARTAPVWASRGAPLGDRLGYSFSRHSLRWWVSPGALRPPGCASERSLLRAALPVGLVQRPLACRPSWPVLLLPCLGGARPRGPGATRHAACPARRASALARAAHFAFCVLDALAGTLELFFGEPDTLLGDVDAQARPATEAASSGGASGSWRSVPRGIASWCLLDVMPRALKSLATCCQGKA